LALRNLVQMLEESDGVELLGHSTDPQEAVHFLSAHPVDLLFLDIHLPGLSGFSLLARFKSRRQSCLRPPTMSMPCRHSAPMRSITC
jgi:DNA-binding NarL/FixJ family response regulator